jgi:hypothetical protein
MCDVGSSHPGAVVGPKGWAVRPLKWYVSWVQNVDILRWFGVIETLVLAYIGEAFIEYELTLNGNAEGRLVFFGSRHPPKSVCESLDA